MDTDAAIRELRTLAESLRPGASRLKYMSRGYRYEDDAEKMAELFLLLDRQLRDRGGLPRDWKK